MKKPGSCIRDVSLYLNEIVEAPDHIDQFIAGVDFHQFQQSEMLRSAIVQRLGIIGEAAVHVSEELATRYHEVPWPQIVAFRKILVHAYFGIDWEVVWRAATNRCPGECRSLASSPRNSAGRQETPVFEKLKKTSCCKVDPIERLIEGVLPRREKHPWPDSRLSAPKPASTVRT